MRENTISNTNKSYISTAASINVNKKAKTSANDLNQRIDKMSNVVTPKLKTESIKFGIQGYKSFYNFKKYSIEPMRKNTEIQMTDYVDRSKLFMNSLKEFMKTNKNKMIIKSSKTHGISERCLITPVKLRRERSKDKELNQPKNSNFISILC